MNDADCIIDYIVKNGLCKTSKISRECDLPSKIVREYCEAHPDITSVKVRQCNVWFTKNRMALYKEDIATCIDEGIDDPATIVKVLGSNALLRDVLTAIIELMNRDDASCFPAEDAIDDPRDR